MNAILPVHELGRLRQAMLLGLARQPLTIPEPLRPVVDAAPERDAALTVLALAGQQRRFQRATIERAANAVPEAARHWHEDRRPVMPAPARRALRRLADGIDKSAADAVLCAAVRRARRAGYRLHPFDLPRLIGHIRGDAGCLGQAERAYLALVDSDSTGADDTSTFLHAEITAANWTGFPKRERVAFLREMRRTRPGQARGLVEGVFKAESASSRADLLAALDVALGADDLPFLENAVNDRAESVRAIATRLIGCVPGTPAYDARLAEAARSFTRRTHIVGFLKRIGLTEGGPSAVFTPPSADAKSRHSTMTDLFNGFSAAQVAEAAGLSPAEVTDALAEEDGEVYAAFASRAARDGDDATMERLVIARLNSATANTRSPAPLLAWLASNLTRPASGDFCRALIGSTAFQAALQRLLFASTPPVTKDDGTLIWTAAVLPAEDMPAFIEMTAPLSPVIAHSARDFADLVLALAAAPTA